ncbi:RHS repeat-associated core domain-containing protein [Pseudomonas sp. NMI760_13]|uniref:RHS repeat-associated core domain-containing protein n=1 Tax=Pseudomonas sp. NMI760_13 TaxID=2903147 RepID=UPI001E5B83D3|nr:RHS repeat-associated core domain-containing protein [Pseudomonas sp. NMI760_13]MCE0917551.1 RHS repeat-associated core domain-containing protein [Pseudomonas sp. NMI760_13]MDC0687636.1 RHS repeat-associated core domain-containing protein [Mitsuaria sp. RG]
MSIDSKRTAGEILSGNTLSRALPDVSVRQKFRCSSHITTLIAAEQNHSPSSLFKSAHPRRCIVYSPYGWHKGVLALLGFNGEPFDPLTQRYHLGHGYRAFSPSLKRFNSPDSISPFGAGGLNSYIYCLGDPVNNKDPDGHITVGQFITDTARTIRNLFKHKNAQNDYQLIGFHGSASIYEKSLAAGIDPGYFGKGAHGDGFYVTDDYKLATAYAGMSASRTRSKARIYGVYIKDFNNLKRGKDFDYAADYKIMVFFESSFDKIKVLPTKKSALFRRNSYYERNTDLNSKSSNIRVDA